jgi:hypothetical protein
VSPLYGIVDAARDQRLFPLICQSPEYACLFAGDIAPPLDAAAPYLVALTDDTPLKDIWRSQGWGKAWGILCRSSQPLKELRAHLRKFLLVKLPDGTTALFRFYDPRVWNAYWAICTAEEKAQWLQGVDEFVAEGAGTVAAS